MANRFTATEKWNDPWFCGLSPTYKLFWMYLCENCNHAGIWNVNWPLVKFHCGEDNFDPIIFGDRVVVLTEEKWFIKKFVLFQQKINDLNELNESNRCHSSIISILRKEGLLRGLEGAAKPVGNSNSKVIVQEGVLRGNQLDQQKEWFKQVISQYPNKNGQKEALTSFCATVITLEDFENINKSLSNYLQSKQVKDGFIKKASNWFNNWQDWLDVKTATGKSQDYLDLMEMAKKKGY